MELTWQEKAEQNWDAQQIRNLMGKYEYYHTAKMHMETVRLFADRDDILIDNSSLGIYKGKEGVKKFFYDFHVALDGDKKGSLCIHTLTTEVIEIARDGQTAKGLWFSPGLETRTSMLTGKLEAYWIWGKYMVDFIKENGEWKFWHFYIIDQIHTEYHKSWVDDAVSKDAVLANPLIPEADAPSRFPGTKYTTDHIEELVPPIPKPYDTFKD